MTAGEERRGIERLATGIPGLEGATALVVRTGASHGPVDLDD